MDLEIKYNGFSTFACKELRKRLIIFLCRKRIDDKCYVLHGLAIRHTKLNLIV
jgi:hypothetical protein